MIVSKTSACVVVAVCLATPVVANGQTSSTLSLRPLHVGDCQVVVQVANPRPGDQVGVVVELTESREQTLIAGRTELTFALSEPLRQGFRVRTRINGVAGKEEAVPAGGSEPKGECVAALQAPDKSPFEASAFFGEVVDTFAPDKVGNYQNPEAGTSQKLQFIFGVDFDYRLKGRSDDPIQFWINGGTMHGVRTADINCKPPDPNDTPPVCGKITDPNFADRARFILEHATSLEAFVSPRVEFKALQRGSDSVANLYATMHLGFISLEEAPQVFRVFHVGIGLLAKEGNFEGSYLQGGWGKNELFSDKWNRLKIDGLISFSMEKIPGVGDNARFFLEMQVDNDLHDGPDSVRTFFGIDLNLKNALGGL
jgi:hypothetical protein